MIISEVAILKHRAMDLIDRLDSATSFSKIWTDHSGYGDGLMEWTNKNIQNIPDGIGVSCGACRVVIWDESNPDYVFKLQRYQCNQRINYSGREYELYEKAITRHLEHRFARIIPLGEYDFINHGMKFAIPYGIYAMEYCDCKEDDIDDDSYDFLRRRLADENGYDFDNLTREQEDEINSSADDCDSDSNMLDWASYVWGDDSGDKVAALLSENRRWDLHSGNWGYLKDGSLVLVDYAGYEG